METLDEATIRDLTEAIASLVMLAALATQCIRFISMYLGLSVRVQSLLTVPFFTCVYASKRIVNRTKHERKFALFPKSPNSRAGLFGIT